MFCATEVIIYNDGKAELVKAEVNESTIGVR
jgi:hypothetical protein